MSLEQYGVLIGKSMQTNVQKSKIHLVIFDYGEENKEIMERQLQTKGGRDGGDKTKEKKERKKKQTEDETQKERERGIMISIASGTINKIHPIQFRMGNRVLHVDVHLSLFASISNSNSQL